MDQANKNSLETHVLRLYELMQKMRADLAVLTDSDGEPVLDSVADQLVSVADDSEQANSAVINANEKITDIAEEMIREIKYTGARHKFQDIVDASSRIDLACEVQEAARARIMKVVDTINQVEGTLNSLVVKVGNGGVAGVETALSGIHMMDEDDGNRAETIKMRSHKEPEQTVN
jgi:hypothetical protein